jgi:hypothetical protein
MSSVMAIPIIEHSDATRIFLNFSNTKCVSGVKSKSTLCGSWAPNFTDQEMVGSSAWSRVKEEYVSEPGLKSLSRDLNSQHCVSSN